MPHSPGVLHFAVVLVNSVVNLPDKRGEFFFWRGGRWGVFKFQRDCNQSCSSKMFLGEELLTSIHQKIYLPIPVA